MQDKPIQINTKVMKQLILLLLIFPTLLYSQGWEKTYGGDGSDYGHQVQQTTDGGYIVVGNKYIYEDSHNDIYLIKTNSNGDTLWTRTYGDTYYDYGFSVQQTYDGGYILLGELGRDWGNDIYMIKTDENGDTLWTKKYGENGYRSSGYSVQQTSDGGYILTGYIFLDSHDVYLIKTDSYGDTLWTRSYDNGLQEEGYSVSQTSDGGYIITGSSYVIDYWQSDIYLIKTDSNGDTIWTKTIDNNACDKASTGSQTSDGGFIIVGATDSTSIPNDHDLFIVKTDVSGSTLWTKTYRLNNRFTAGYCIQQTTDNGYIVTGITNTIQGNSEILLMKTDSLGDTLWTKAFGGESYDYGYYVEQTSDGGFIISGSAKLNHLDSGYDVILIKTDKYGSVLSTIEIPVPNPNRKLMKIVDLSGREISRPLKNQPYIEVYDDGTTKKKMKLK